MKKIKLENPIKIDGVEVNEISLRPPKVCDLIASSKKNIDEAEKEVNLIANLGEISPETVQELDLRDYIKIQEWLRDFLSASTERK